MKVERADLLPDGWREWLLWLEVCRDMGVDTDPNKIRLVHEDAGRNIGFGRIVASRDHSER